MVFIESTPEQLEKYRQMAHEGPIVMCNLLRFKPGGGAKMYEQYSSKFVPLFQSKGGRVLFSGRYLMPLIGDDDWHLLTLVEYPSVQAFVDFVQSEEYQDMAPLRAQSLADSRNWALKPNQIPPR